MNSHTLERFEHTYAALTAQKNVFQRQVAEIEQRLQEADNIRAMMESFIGAKPIGSVEHEEAPAAFEPEAPVEPEQKPVEVAAGLAAVEKEADPAPLSNDPTDVTNLEANDQALMDALNKAYHDQPGVFLTDSQLWKIASGMGFTLKRPSVSNRMSHAPNALVKRFPDLIDQQDKPLLGWRIKDEQQEPDSPAGNSTMEADKVPLAVLPEDYPRFGKSSSDLGKKRMAWLDARLKAGEDRSFATCQICGADFNANAGIIRDHGHRRAGYNVGACLGSGAMPFELDPLRLRWYINEFIPAEIKKDEEAITSLEVDGMAMVYDENQNRYVLKTRADYENDESWQAFKSEKLRRLRTSIQAFEMIKVRETQRYKSWKPKAIYHM